MCSCGEPDFGGSPPPFYITFGVAIAFVAAIVIFHWAGILP